MSESKETSLPKTSVPATTALAHIGITNLTQLSKHTKKEIASLHGVGPKALRIWEEEMKKLGLNFKSSNT